MPRVIPLLIVIVLSVILSSCTKDNADLIIGNWLSDHADQVEGTNEDLSHFNFLEITRTEINLMKYTEVYVVKAGKMVRRFDEKYKNVKYELQPGSQIIIDNTLYDVELKKHEMIIKNENIEIHYNKVNK